MALRADDGTPLQIKEGVMLDRDGAPIGPPPHERWRAPRVGTFRGQTRVFVWRGGGLLAPLVLIPAFLLLATIGVTIFGFAASVALVLWALFTIRRILFGRL